MTEPMNESTDEQVYIVCLPVKEGPPAVPAAGMRCAKCRVEVWVSEAVVPRVIYGGIKPLCLMCWYPMHLSGESREGEILPEVRKDLQQLGIEEVAEKLMATLNADVQRRKARRN